MISKSSSRTTKSLEGLHVIACAISDLRPWKRNARTHSRKQIEQIAASIREFGFTNPVLVDESGNLIAGHGRVEAARILGMSEVPVIRIEHLTSEQKRAYVIADNRLALNAGWDAEILQIEFAELADIDLDFDMEITGFATAEIDLLIDGPPASAKQDPADVAPEATSGPAVTRAGDLWHLGSHRLLCADARDPGAFQALMGDERARVVFSDPPYNVKIDGHVCGAGLIKHREFAMASGEMTRTQFVSFLSEIFRNLAEVSLDGSIHYHCIDWRHLGEMVEAGESVYAELKNLCIWVKDNGGMGSFYRSQHELIFVWKLGTAGHINTIELGKHGRYRTNVWNYPGVNTLRAGRMNELAMHPTVKPVSMISDALKDSSRSGDVVLDCFGGSGSTLIAAEKTRRKARLVEIDPHYCDVIVRRWQDFTRNAGVLAPTGQTWAEIRIERLESRGDES
jgi:DNA modification methylase